MLLCFGKELRAAALKHHCGAVCFGGLGEMNHMGVCFYNRIVTMECSAYGTCKGCGAATPRNGGGAARFYG